VFTHQPPAPTPAKLREMLARDGHVTAEAVGDGIDELLATFIAELTDVDPTRRPGEAADVLESLDQIEEGWTEPEAHDDEPHVTAARRGSTLVDGRFAVLGRLGRGSTAFTLLVRDTPNENRLAVLKVAEGPELNERIAAEASALRELDHPTIVKLY